MVVDRVVIGSKGIAPEADHSRRHERRLAACGHVLEPQSLLVLFSKHVEQVFSVRRNQRAIDITRVCEPGKPHLFERRGPRRTTAQRLTPSSAKTAASSNIALSAAPLRVLRNRPRGMPWPGLATAAVTPGLAKVSPPAGAVVAGRASARGGFSRELPPVNASPPPGPAPAPTSTALSPSLPPPPTPPPLPPPPP